jgi:hypothetical protein
MGRSMIFKNTITSHSPNAPALTLTRRSVIDLGESYIKITCSRGRVYIFSKERKIPLRDLICPCGRYIVKHERF